MPLTHSHGEDNALAITISRHQGSIPWSIQVLRQTENETDSELALDIAPPPYQDEWDDENVPLAHLIPRIQVIEQPSACHIDLEGQDDCSKCVWYQKFIVYSMVGSWWVIIVLLLVIYMLV